MHRVAVIMSVYQADRLEFVKMSVQSILEQTFTDFDFYIAFDGMVQSDVAAYIDSLRDTRVFIAQRSQNLGLAVTLNELLSIVLPKGYEFIARMDADDVSSRERFQRQVQFLQAHPEIDCLGTWAIEITSSGQEYFKKQMPETHEQCLRLFRTRDCLIHPTVMFRRTFFERAGLYPTDTYFGEDTIMWAKGFQAGCRFANLQEYLFKFRIDDQFFRRRRGWKHAKSIWSLRCRVNRMLGFGFVAYVYALLYALAKLMPTKILNLIYKTSR